MFLLGDEITHALLLIMKDVVLSAFLSTDFHSFFPSVSRRHFTLASSPNVRDFRKQHRSCAVT